MTNTTYDPTIDDDEIKRIRMLAGEVPPSSVRVAAPPSAVDLSPHLRFIRRQAGGGCWGYAWLAVWDIMNDLVCPFSPNLSMNLWLARHRSPKNVVKYPDGREVVVITCPDGRSWIDDDMSFFTTFGLTTEGTELNHHSYTGGWTYEGINEAGNYRWNRGTIGHSISSDALMNCLAKGLPIRVQIPSEHHFVAIVGYDTQKRQFKYVNSMGDKWGDGGYSYFTFDQIDDPKQRIIDLAQTIEIVCPRPVPAARIKFTHSNRLNVHLWLRIEGSLKPKRAIWPHLPLRAVSPDQDVDDNSGNLHYTVRLPSELMWPPTPQHRVILDLYDSAAFSNTGGYLEEFTIGFGGHPMACEQLKNGKVAFKPLKHYQFTIP